MTTTSSSIAFLFAGQGAQAVGMGRELDRDVPAARELFDRAYREMRERNQGVRLLGVAAGNIVIAGPADLFEPDKRTREREVTSAVDKVREKYGFDAMRPAKLLEKKGRQGEAK
jgi:malonyl CoA-acyl carrier protein transacylase